MIKKYLGDTEIKYTEKLMKGPQAGLIKVILRGLVPGLPGPRHFLTEQQYRAQVRHVVVSPQQQEASAA